jgi:catechol 2,3-dioxygenase-like lactoylglutathione lyase family enzyme
MLKDCRVFTTLPVTDPDRARAFYAEKLGLTPTAPGGDFYECGAGTRAGHTQMGFVVEDVAATVKELRARGLVFEEYDWPTLKTVDSVFDNGELKSAWFKDSEGNTIGIMQPVEEGFRIAAGAAVAGR